MMHRFSLLLLALAILGLAAPIEAQRRSRSDRDRDRHEESANEQDQEKAAELQTGPQPAIAWYGNLEQGLAVAKKTKRPIFLMSAAPHRMQTPGLW